jgi:hypothetical protein
MTQFDPSMLPGHPDVIPQELRASADLSAWSARVPPQAVGMFVAAVAQWLSDPRFGVSVNVESDPQGWTLRVGLPTPTDDAVTVG